MKACDEKLRDSILRVMEQEDAELEEEMKQFEPHVFSESFEKKMEEVMRVQARKSKRSSIIRYVAVAVVVALLVGGILFIGSEDLRASEIGVGILEWMENFFVVENDTNRSKDEDVDVLFDESQIGYLPEGFEKVEEEVTFSKVNYLYQNDDDEYVSLLVYRNKASLGVDNDEIVQEVALNDAGLEYRYIYKVDSSEHIITWIDKEELCYSLSSSLEKEEIMRIIGL